MAELWIDAEGVIERAEGNTEPLLGFRPEELVGLPCELLHPELSEPGLHTLFVRRRDGQTVLIHAFVDKDPASGECKAHLQDVFGGETERARLAFQYALFRGLAFAAEYGDPDLLEHLQRVERYTSWIARGALGLSETDVARLTVAAYVHDVGKSAIPREILYKPAPLTPEERTLVETHTDKGWAVLQEVERHVKRQASWLYDELTWRLAKDVARYHHENWDGTGYPEKKAGEDIPLAARVVKVVDVLDALLHARPYKSAWSNEQVRREIIAKTKTEFDPKLAEWLLAHEEQWLQTGNSANAGGNGPWWH
ncbi:HD-GYP domain-containing protein [Alicyclobacillus macrosporangiidus]|uniref:HD-GYP domain-containing protein n=1 Tax=Alicyclobacillus macrosporangiidus TaxID=392015 RepID=UPI0004965014|nr:HD domain-containing phosphohydrolase [Alicyclobacillus macrosporangiidus]